MAVSGLVLKVLENFFFFWQRLLSKKSKFTRLRSCQASWLCKFYNEFGCKKISNFFYNEFDCENFSNFFYNKFGCKNFSFFLYSRINFFFCREKWKVISRVLDPYLVTMLFSSQKWSFFQGFQTSEKCHLKLFRDYLMSWKRFEAI